MSENPGIYLKDPVLKNNPWFPKSNTCRHHFESGKCLGPLQIRRSVYGAQKTACEASFLGSEKMWPELLKVFEPEKDE